MPGHRPGQALPQEETVLLPGLCGLTSLSWMNVERKVTSVRLCPANQGFWSAVGPVVGHPGEAAKELWGGSQRHFLKLVS